MIKSIFVGIIVAIMALSGVVLAEEPPANYGELAELMVEGWEIPAAADPGDGDPNIAALGDVGIGPGSVASSDGISAYGSSSWDSFQELTVDFYCALKVAVWAAAQSGLIPYWPEGSGTPAVTDMNGMSQVNHDCAPAPPYEPPTKPLCPCPTAAVVKVNTEKIIEWPDWCLPNPNCFVATITE